MPDFKYTARDNSGEKVSGSLEAESRREAIAALSARGLFPIEVGADSADDDQKQVRRVPAQLMSVTYGQLSDLLGSGVPLLRALEVIQKQTSHKGLSRVLGQVRHSVEDGASLSEAMEPFPRVFGEMATSMVRAGSEGGFLEEALLRVADFTETQDDLKKRVVGALAYPVVLIVVGTLVVSGIMIFLVPRFETLFSRLRDRNELPALTEGLLWISELVGTWGIWVLLAAIGGGFLARYYLRTDAGWMWWDRVKLHLPLVGPIFLSLAVARFCRVLGTLLHNGVPIIRSLDISRGAAANRVLSAAISEATENISAGETLAEPLAASGHFPPAVIEMIAVAEQANNLENVLLKIADSLENRTWRRLDLAVRMLEPLMLLLLASAVLLVVIALLLPVFRMSQTISG